MAQQALAGRARRPLAAVPVAAVDTGTELAVEEAVVAVVAADMPEGAASEEVLPDARL